MTSRYSSECYPFVSQEARDSYLSYYDKKARQCWPVLVDAENRHVETSFGRTFVRVGGPKEAPPLVLIPGDSETSLAWSFTIQALSTGCRTYALDHVNDIGRSIPKNSLTAPDDFVRYLDELLEKLNLHQRRINLVAHSCGGWQACLYAVAHPERLEKLVLLAPTATVLPIRFGVLMRAILFSLIPFRWYFKYYMHWYAPASVKMEGSRKAIDEMVEEELLARKCFTYRKSDLVIPTVLADEDWQHLTVPTLFLVGDQEVMYDPEDAVRRLDRITRKGKVTSVIVPNADHHLALVQPAWVSKSVIKFLSGETAAAVET